MKHIHSHATKGHASYDLPLRANELVLFTTFFPQFLQRELLREKIVLQSSVFYQYVALILWLTERSDGIFTLVSFPELSLVGDEGFSFQFTNFSQ